MTLRKMYLFTAEHFQQSLPPTQSVPQSPLKKTGSSVKTKRVAKKNVKQHSHDKWGALCTTMLEPDLKETELIRRFGDFLHKLLPQSTPQKRRNITVNSNIVAKSKY